MGVETWMYRHLGRPWFQVPEDLLVDVHDESVVVD